MSLRVHQLRSRPKLPVKRTVLSLALGISLAAGVVPAASAVEPISAAELSTPSSALPQPAKDKAGVLELWHKGGELTKAAAKAALLGDDAALQDFIAKGQYVVLSHEYRLITIQLAALGGFGVREAAAKALSAGTWPALQQFVNTGWKAEQDSDNEAATSRNLLDPAGNTAKKDAQAALDSGSDAVREFIDNGLAVANETDDRKAVYKLVLASPSVAAAAQKVLDSSDPQVARDFLRYGQYVEAAKDAKNGTVPQLANQTKSFAVQATILAQKAGGVIDSSAKATALAAQATVQTANEITAGLTSAQKNDAANRTAESALQAAKVSQLGASGAQDLRTALLLAFKAAENAQAEAIRTEQIAAATQGAATSAALTKSAAASAKAAAANARTRAIDAQQAVLAAQQAIATVQNIKKSAPTLSDISKSAAQAATAAAQAAAAAGLSAESADAAKFAANQGAEVSSRIEKDSSLITSTVSKLEGQLNSAKADIEAAIKRTNTAALAADDAAAHTGDPQIAVAKSTQYSAAAKASADAATVGDLQRLKAVQDAAAQALAERAAAKRAFLTASASADKHVASNTAQAAKALKAKTASIESTMVELGKKFAAPGADLNALASEAKSAAFLVLEAAPAWQQAAAEGAILGSSAQSKSFVTQQWRQAQQQDQWDAVRQLALAGPEELRAPAKAVLYQAYAGKTELLAQFLATDRWELTKTRDRKALYAMLSTAGSSLQKAINETLDADSPAVTQDFFENRQYLAADTDRRKSLYQLIATATGDLADAVQIALDGPPSAAIKFFAAGEYQATSNNQEAASLSSFDQMIFAKSTSEAGVARSNAASAAQIAAQLKKNTAEAKNQATLAAAHAAFAQRWLDQATGFAKQAAASFDQANASSQTARNGLAQLRKDQETSAVENAKLVSLGFDPQDTTSVAKQRNPLEQRADDASADFVQAGVAPLNDVQLANAKAAGGEAAVQRLKDAKALSEKAVYSFILEQHGQPYLDALGADAALLCSVQADPLDCAVANLNRISWTELPASADSMLLVHSRVIAPKLATFQSDQQAARKQLFDSAIKAATKATFTTQLGQAKAKIPAAWGAGTANTMGVGSLWKDPASPANSVRVDQASSSSTLDAQHKDYVVVHSGGKLIGADGSALTEGTVGVPESAHIPLSSYLSWSSWDKP